MVTRARSPITPPDPDVVIWRAQRLGRPSVDQGGFDVLPPLELAIVQALDQRIPSLRASAQAWLGSYHLALSLGFTERAALCQAAAAWDRAVAAWRPSSQEPRFELTESGRRAIHEVHV